ncbi:MAG: phage tail tape measure protein [Bacteroidetes bacterium]|nr:phage tail tape measure protein [Bacteroidota bacterium]
MAKARIVYVVDDKQLKELQGELNQIKKKNKEVAKGFGDSEKEIKKTKTSLVDLKGVIAGIGLAALATGAIVAFAKLTKEINKNRKETALLTKETGAALDSITAKIRATSRVFEKDYNEVLRTANAVSQQLGISMTETMDEINEAMSRGLDINGQYLETISEYSPFMKQAGIDFRQFNILIQKQVTEGIFSNTGIDSIKEAVISIQEMTPATVDALKAVGFNTTQLIKDIESGAKTYFDVIKEIGTKLADVTDQRVRGQVLADIFRGAGEDAGDFAITLQTVGTEFVELTEDQEKYIKGQRELIEATIATEKALISLTASTQGLGIQTAILWEKVKLATLRGVEATINLFISLEDQFINFQNALKGADLDTLTDVYNDLQKELKDVADRFEEAKNATIKNSVEIKILGGEALTLAERIKFVKDEIIDLATEEKLEALAADKATKAAKSLAEAKILQAKATLEAKRALSIERQGLTDIEGKGIDPLDLVSQIADETLSIEQRLQDGLITIRERTREIDKEAEGIKSEETKERNQTMIEFALGAAIQLNEIQAQFAQLKIDQINQELTALEFARNRELELAEGNAQREAEINARFDAQKRQLQNEQLKKEKEVALFRIAINTAGAILKAIEIFGPPPSPFGITAIAFAATIGLVQAGIVLSKKIPEFKEGVLRLQGPGTRTSDSIYAKLSVDETVLSAQTTDDYYPAIKAIYNREIAPEVLNNLVMNQDTRPGTVVYDYDKLANAVMSQPQSRMYFDENGFTQHIIKKSISIQKKQNKYKM